MELKRSPATAGSLLAVPAGPHMPDTEFRDSELEAVEALGLRAEVAAHRKAKKGAPKRKKARVGSRKSGKSAESEDMADDVKVGWIGAPIHKPRQGLSPSYLTLRNLRVLRWRSCQSHCNV